LKILFWRIDAVLGSVNLITHDDEQQKNSFAIYYKSLYDPDLIWFYPA